MICVCVECSFTLCCSITIVCVTNKTTNVSTDLSPYRIGIKCVAEGILPNHTNHQWAFHETSGWWADRGNPMMTNHYLILSSSPSSNPGELKYYIQHTAYPWHFHVTDTLLHFEVVWHLILWQLGVHLNIKLLSYPYRDPHVKDKMVSWPFNL